MLVTEARGRLVGHCSDGRACFGGRAGQGRACGVGSVLQSVCRGKRWLTGLGCVLVCRRLRSRCPLLVGSLARMLLSGWCGVTWGRHWALPLNSKCMHEIRTMHAAAQLPLIQLCDWLIVVVPRGHVGCGTGVSDGTQGACMPHILTYVQQHSCHCHVLRQGP